MGSIINVKAAKALALNVVLAVVVPLFTEAQPTEKLRRIGMISEFSPADPFVTAFQQGLRDLGYVEGRNIVVEYRYAHGVLARVSNLAAELISLRVEILVVGGTKSAQLAKAQTTTVPIVFATSGDPVSSGLVASIAHPGGNATGISLLSPELSGKRLELLKAAAPRGSRVSVLYNPVNPAAGDVLNATREAARALSLELQLLEVRPPKELPGAFSALTGWRAGALLVLPDPLLGNELDRIRSSPPSTACRQCT
jgi:putative ABC transport system substrate-binding protein